MMFVLGHVLKFESLGKNETAMNSDISDTLFFFHISFVCIIKMQFIYKQFTT
jgi:hypothetical protein